MRIGSLVVAGCLLLTPAPAGADKGGKDKQGKGGRHAEQSVTIVFSSGQREAARGFFVETHGRGNCPPGLAKKQNGCLPPGLAKKRYLVGRPLPPGTQFAPPPPVLAARIGPAPKGYRYVMLDGDLVQLAVGTMIVVDAIQGLVE